MMKPVDAGEEGDITMMDQGMKKVAVFALTPQGKELRKQLLAEDTPGWSSAELDDIETLFQTCDGLIFIMATGIVVRYIAPLLRHKREDPAVVVLDQAGRYVISLLSGHLGGANDLARAIAAQLTTGGHVCLPVITTGTDVADVTAFDVFAKANQLTIEDISQIKYISSDLIAGRPIQVGVEGKLSGSFRGPVMLLDFPETSPTAVKSDKTNENLSVEGRATQWNPDLNRVLVTSQCHVKGIPPSPHCLWLRPKDIYLGIGCKKNTAPQKLIRFICHQLRKYDIFCGSIACLSSHQVKANESAMHAAAKYFQCPLVFYKTEELEPYCIDIEYSDFVKQTVGVGAVSAPAAKRAAGPKSHLLIEKIRYDGMTLSIVKKEMQYTAC
ncbi:MAG TPA: hypothetical protein GX717_02965 [Clostridiaceae bacterium]|nr:hypothetical protein [Clostridiaceae bacterium]